jgi:hypothetical protein
MRKLDRILKLRSRELIVGMLGGILLLISFLVNNRWLGHPEYILLASFGAILGFLLLLTLSKIQILSLLVMIIPFDPFELGPLSVSDALLILLAIRVTLDIWEGKRFVPFSGIYLWGSLFLVVGIFSWWRADKDILSQLTVAGRSSGGRILITVATMVVLNWSTFIVGTAPGAIERIVKALLRGGAVAAGAAIVELVLFYGFDVSLGPTFVGHFSFGNVLRPTGFYYNPNFFALLLVGPLVMGLSNWKSLDRRYRQITLLILLIYVATMSRAAWLTLITFIVIRLMLLKIPRRELPILLMLFAVVLAVVGPVAWRFILNMSPASFYARKVIIENAIRMFLKKPLMGWGPGVLVEMKWDPSMLAFVQSLPGGRHQRQGAIKGTHNTFLQSLTWVGIGGTLAWFGVMFTSVRCFWRVRKHADLFLWSVFFALLAVLFESLFAEALLLKQTWVLSGLLMAGSRSLRKST